MNENAMPTDEEMEDLARRLQQMPSPLTLALTPLQAVMLLAQLQLALRHPANRGPASQEAIQLARYVQDMLAAFDPEIGRFVERGWHGCFDAPASSNFPP